MERKFINTSQIDTLLRLEKNLSFNKITQSIGMNKKFQFFRIEALKINY